MGTESSEPRATGGGPSSSSAAGGSAFAEGPDADMGTPTFNLDDLRKVIQEQELAEQTESEGRRIPKEEGVLEVDAKISLERERVLEQEALIQKMNANPWFIYEQGVTRLKWPSGAYVVSEYGDGSLREPFNSRLILEKIKKRWSELESGARNFASHFGRKAFNDLAEYDFVKAKHADRLQDLLDRPYEGHPRRDHRLFAFTHCCGGDGGRRSANSCSFTGLRG